MNSTSNFSPETTFVGIIVDHSGSMGGKVSNSEEARDYNRNDFARQGAKLCALGALDGMYMGVIKFDSSASIVAEPVQLNGSNRSAITDAINTIQPAGGTNIMSALVEANRMIRMVKEVYGITRAHLILFTDGEDTNLNETNVASKMAQFAPNGEYPFTMDTVGFGPDANTQLLVQMASLCGGTYALCYDASMVGTIFGRAIARTYLGSEAFGVYETDEAKSPEYYRLKSDYHRFRGELSQLLLAQYRMLPDRVQAVDAFNTKLEEWLRSVTQTTQTDPDWYTLICALHSDLNGQIRLALLNPNYWTLWGKAYWQMMGIALAKQYAPNFKDECLQHFGSVKAKEEYARVSAIYDELPFLPPSNRGIGYSSGSFGLSAATTSTPVTGSNFNNQHGGCFHPESKVLLSSGEYVSFRVVEQMVKSGTQVLIQSTNMSNAQVVKLETLIKSDMTMGPTQFCKVSLFGAEPVVLTPTHPLIGTDGEWVHPKTISTPYEEQVDCVYNVVLGVDYTTGKRAQSIFVNGVECAGLAHGIKEEESTVAYDTFWGSEEIVNVLKKLYPESYESGFVQFTHKFKRNATTGWVDSVAEV
jgi:hypothetical protein